MHVSLGSLESLGTHRKSPSDKQTPRKSLLWETAGQRGSLSQHWRLALMGRTLVRAADAPRRPTALCKMLISLFRRRDEGVPRGPGVRPTAAARFGVALGVRAAIFLPLAHVGQRHN